MKPEFSRFIGQRARQRHRIFRARMPVDDDVYIIEKSCPYHINFPRPAFFRRAAIYADGPAEFFFGDQFFDGDARRYGSSAE